MHRTLAEQYPDAHCELIHDGPYQLLVATVLSAQTTDVQVNKVTPALFTAYPTPADLAAAPLEDIEHYVKSTGFYRAKANSIKKLAISLVHNFNQHVPSTLDELVTLPGVGRKTANVVLGNAFNVPGITVDTHFGRLARRFGWTDADDPTIVEQHIGALFPRKDWTMLSHRLIFHGRRSCHARRPACGACVLAHECPSFGIGETNPEIANKLLKPATAAQRAAMENT